MKKLYFILWVFLACFVVFPPVEVSGQSVVLIEKDTFQMYSNPLGADSTLSAKVSDRLYDSCYIRDLSVSGGDYRMIRCFWRRSRIVTAQYVLTIIKWSLWI